MEKNYITITQLSKYLKYKFSMFAAVGAYKANKDRIIARTI